MATAFVGHLRLESMRFLLPALALLTCVHLANADQAAPLVYMVGDSTMAQKPLDLPERGWGMAMSGFFKDAAMIQNHAVNGRSTKSFINEGRWTRVIDAVVAGDFVIIEFGHNDEKVEKAGVGTDPNTEFRDNLRRFIRDVKKKRAIPILATPIARRKFDENGKLISTHGAYPDAMRAVAAEEQVALLDLEHDTEAWLRTEGPDHSKRFFMWIAPGVYPKFPQGRQDDTHLVESGAVKVASLAAEEIRAQNLPLARWLK